MKNLIIIAITVTFLTLIEYLRSFESAVIVGIAVIIGKQFDEKKY